MRGTWGTETTKYPEEEKSKEIPPVVASERGRGQTEGFILRGCGLANDLSWIAERCGKADHSG